MLTGGSRVGPLRAAYLRREGPLRAAGLKPLTSPLGRGNTPPAAGIAPIEPAWVRNYAIHGRCRAHVSGHRPRQPRAGRQVSYGRRWFFATDEFWQDFESEGTSCQPSKSA